MPRSLTYHAVVRTTIGIDDELLRRLKQRAKATGRTLDELIEDALRLLLEHRPVPTERSLLPTFGGSGTMPGVDLSSNTRLLDLLDANEPLDGLR